MADWTVYIHPQRISGWHYNQIDDYHQVILALDTAAAADNNPVALDRLVRASGGSGAWDVAPDCDAARREMHEFLDNIINQGGEPGGCVWVYRGDELPDGPRPTGKNGERILGNETKKIRFRSYRAFREGADLYVGCIQRICRTCGLPVSTTQHQTQCRNSAFREIGRSYKVSDPHELARLAQAVYRYRLFRDRRPTESTDAPGTPGSQPGSKDAGYDEVDEAMHDETNASQNEATDATRPSYTSADLAALIKTANEKLAAALSGRRSGSLSHQFALLTRCFLGYVADTCESRALPGGRGGPTFARWMLRVADAPPPPVLDQESLRALVAHLDDPNTGPLITPSYKAAGDSAGPAQLGSPGIGADGLASAVLEGCSIRNCPCPIPADGLGLAVLRERMEPKPARMDRLRRELAGHLTARPHARTDDELEDLCARHFARLASRLDAHRWSQVRDRWPESGEALLANPTVVTRLQDPEPDPQTWRALAQPGLVRGRVALAVLDPDAPTLPLPPLYDVWHDACFSLLAPGGGQWLCPHCAAAARAQGSPLYRQADALAAAQAVRKGDRQVRCGVCGTAPDEGPPNTTGKPPAHWWRLQDDQSRKTLGAALDKAKSRLELEPDGILDEFYVLIGHVPADRAASRRGKPGGPAGPGALIAAETLCERVRALFDRFLRGNVKPAEAHEFRQHLAECQGCFWAFSDFVDDRMAWGYHPQPAVAALRERMQSLDPSPRLKLLLGRVPADPQDIREEIIDWRAKLAAVPALQPAGRERGAVEPTLRGFLVNPDRSGWREAELGQELRIKRLDAQGNTVGSDLAARIIAVERDLEDRSASLTVQLDPPFAPGAVLMAQADDAGLRFTLMADLEQGVATLDLADVPEELNEVRIERWYVTGDPVQA